MLLCANAALEENKQKINELNVFPVPDGDTGTNMSLTMNSAAIELGRKQTETVGGMKFVSNYQDYFGEVWDKDIPHIGFGQVIKCRTCLPCGLFSVLHEHETQD